MKRKIVYCIPSLYFPSGMERVLTLKANYFADVLGYEIYIILTDNNDKEPYYKLSSKIKLINLDINFDTNWRLPIYKRVISYFIKQIRYRRKLKELLFEIKPDITISTLRREINFINSIKDGSKKMGEIHFSRTYYRDMESNGKKNILRKMISKLWMFQLVRELKKLSMFVTLSSEDNYRWIEIKNRTFIYNPLSFFPDKVSDCNTKQVIAVGRYTYQKGFDMLIESWEYVKEKHPDWVLKIYGGGERKSFEGLRDNLGLEENVFLEKSTDNIIDKYCESSLFVLSSRFEGFGMVITEAMACGLPAVSFTCPSGPMDIIKDGEDGLWVENGNIKELAEKISYLIENDELRKEMGSKARINVERFKIENIAKQWVDLFDKVLS
ncbi:MAG: glycosyltransferase family 4 protein [Bacteroidetes bacterium]|nr:glycosyltransferase family 4 protein [Bacteroidota bacterium]